MFPSGLHFAPRHQNWYSWTTISFEGQQNQVTKRAIWKIFFMWEHGIFKNQLPKFVANEVVVRSGARMQILIERNLPPSVDAINYHVYSVNIRTRRQIPSLFQSSTHKNKIVENGLTYKWFLWRCVPSVLQKVFENDNLSDHTKWSCEKDINLLFWDFLYAVYGQKTWKAPGRQKVNGRNDAGIVTIW